MWSWRVGVVIGTQLSRIPPPTRELTIWIYHRLLQQRKRPLSARVLVGGGVGSKGL